MNIENIQEAKELIDEFNFIEKAQLRLEAINDVDNLQYDFVLTDRNSTVEVNFGKLQNEIIGAMESVLNDRKTKITLRLKEI